jgi:hypothetical protein
MERGCASYDVHTWNGRPRRLFQETFVLFVCVATPHTVEIRTVGERNLPEQREWEKDPVRLLRYCINSAVGKQYCKTVKICDTV